MKPGQIQVFDGLRLTTEHMNHLQGAFHSAVQDIRQILGLGQVHTGFELVKENDQSITVMPGVAFDLQRNRIVCDEPKTLDVSFADGETTRYVCVKYEQIEDGLVEGQPTLIWDSCDIQIRSTLPETAENAVAIAALVQQPETGTFEIHSLEAMVESTPPPTPTSQPQLPIQQGILRLGAENGDATSLHALLLEPLRQKLSNSNNGDELHFTLTGNEISLDLPPVSLTCQTLFEATLTAPQPAGGGEISAAEEVSLLANEAKFQATAHGEVTFLDHSVTQFGVSTIYAYHTEQGDRIWPAFDITEQGIAHLPLATSRTGTDTEALENVMRNLQLFVKVEETEQPGFKAIGKLLWKGGVNREIIEMLESIQAHLGWKATIAWKTISKLPDKVSELS